MILKGKVTKGLGKAKYWVGLVFDEFYKTTNIELFPGTLNIKLEKPYTLEPDFIIKKEKYGGTENVLVQKCRILGTEAYIVRAEKNQKGYGEHKQDILEVVSDINFRKKYNLEDNKIIEIEV